MALRRWELYFQGLQPALPPALSPQLASSLILASPEAHRPLPLQDTTTAPPGLQFS